MTSHVHPAYRPPLTATNDNDPYRRIAAKDYFKALFGIEVPDDAMVHCPFPDHTDEHPSCSVSDRGFFCYGCSDGGGIYDAASLAIGGQAGRAMGTEDFDRAAAHVKAIFKEA